LDLAVVGPMSRSADDLMLALDVLAGPDDADRIAYNLHLPAARRDRLRDFRVCVLDQHPLLPTQRSIVAAVDEFAERLSRAGCKVGRRSPAVPDLAAIGVLYQTLLTSFLAANSKDTDFRRTRAESDASADPIAAASARGFTLSHRDWIQGDRLRTGFAHRWRMFFRDWDVVVCPVMPTLAFRHDHREMQDRSILVDGEPVADLRQTAWVATLTGQPATSMPIGISAEGLPIGVQVIGPRLEDRTTIRFASLCEQAFGGFVPPPMVR
jgi:amidase